jgi:hypothetical protein
MGWDTESSSQPVRKYDQEESAFRFLLFCVVLAATIFTALNFLSYVATPTNSAANANSAAAMKFEQTIRVAPWMQ